MKKSDTTKLRIKKACLWGLGAALFVVLSLCLQVPVFENYYLCLGYIAVMVFCYFFGPASGMFVGGAGVILYCLLINGVRGLPGWFLANLIIGLVIGLTCKLTMSIKSIWLRHLIIILAIIISTGVGVLIVKSFVEVILYSQPMFVRIAKNFPAFITDVIVLIAGVPVCLNLRKVVQKTCVSLIK